MLEEEKAKIGRLSLVVLCREYARPVAMLWRALTDATAVSQWMEYPTQLDPRVGGRIVVDFSPDDGIDGIVTAAVENKLLLYTWGDTLVKWEVSESGSGCALLFSHIGVEPERAPGLAAGWHAFLDHLGPYLEGKRVRDRFSELETAYQSAVSTK
jgi:uncharacterized protein YndB with AHSA1/START domain